MWKKVLKWTAIVFGVLIIALITAPFLFKDKIKNLVINTINENLDATVNFEDVDLSLIRNFPKASVTISKLSVINKAPFEGDTLVYSESIRLKMSVKELFKSEGEPMQVQEFGIENALINIIFNKDGVGNFDIALKDDEEEDPDKSDPSTFAMSLQSYEIKNLKFSFWNQASDMKMVLSQINHKGSGDFTSKVVDLDTYTTAVALFELGNVKYLNQVDLTLDAVLNLDLEHSKYTFKENMARIEKLPLEFDGYIQMKEEGQEYDLKFSAPTTSFSNFLALIPSAYSGSLENIKTSGEFSVKGFAKGMLTDTTIPTFDLTMVSQGASFKFPELPKSVENFTLDLKVKNETGLFKDTYVNLDNLSFLIDKDRFHAMAKLRNITENMLIDANLDGVLNLGNLSKAYPIKLEQELSGIIKADVALNLDMNSVEQQKYENVKAQGTLNLTGFRYEGAELSKPLAINEADLKFSPSKVSLNKFDAKMGKSDLQASGTLDNFYGFLFKDQVLKGDFGLQSNHIELADFMSSTSSTPTEKQSENPKKDAASGEMKIPSFLDCSITAKVHTVIYDNLTLKDVSGKLMIKDQTVTLQNMMTSIFGGKIGFNGMVSTQQAKPTFDMALKLQALDIPQAFTQLSMLEKIAPIAKVLSGKFTSDIKLSGALDAKELTPDLNSLSGDLFGQLSESRIKPEESKLLSSLNSNLKFIDFNKLNLDKVKAQFAFKNGKVNIKPIDLNYQDIKIQFSGSHGFDQSMEYDAAFSVPAKYLGQEISGLLANLSGNQAQTMLIPIKAQITGNFTSPKIQTDMKQAIAGLTQQIVDKQKNDLINKGKNTLGDLIEKNVKKDSTSSVPITKEEVNKKVEEKKEEVKKDLENKAKDALKNLLGGKK